MEELRLWAAPLEDEEVAESAHRRLECAEGNVAIWPMYEGAEAAAREVCGRGAAFKWDTEEAGPVWDNPEMFFCPSACTACEPCTAAGGCSRVECTACLPGLPRLYQGDCYSECPPGSLPDGDDSCRQDLRGSPPPPLAPPQPEPPTAPGSATPQPTTPAPPGRPDTPTLFPAYLCMDSIQNNGEADLDCGGPCPVCSAYVDVEVELQVCVAASLHRTTADLQAELAV